MRAAEDERVDGSTERREVALRDEVEDGTLGPALLGERHEERARHRHDLDPRALRPQECVVARAPDRSFGPDHADASRRRDAERRVDAGLDDAEDRDAASSPLALEIVERPARRGVASDDERLDAPTPEVAGHPARIPHHGLGRPSPVRHARGVPEVDEVLGGEPFSQGFEDREPADARVEDGDR